MDPEAPRGSTAAASDRVQRVPRDWGAMKDALSAIQPMLAGIASRPFGSSAFAISGLASERESSG